jgi:predicted short-subunit dehydrogenase-like oxidoreductase (DUF2520 family)
VNPRARKARTRSHPSPVVTIIGPGRAGQALGRLLARSGVRVASVAARKRAQARQAARFIGTGRPVSLDSPELVRADVLLITTSDSALARMSQAVAVRRADWRGCIVLHTSGAWPAGGEGSVLDAFRKRGAAAASLHPLQTVPSREAGVRNLIGCFWAVEGDRRAVRLARQWVRALHGSAFALRSSRKPAYHAAAVMACAGVVTLMEGSRRLLGNCGLAPKQARKVLEGFVAETARNFAVLGARRALTGPMVRGDWPTLRRHEAALRALAPDLLPLYREINRSMLKIAGKRSRRRAQ